MKLNKGILIAGIAAVCIVIGGGVGGALLALNTESESKTQTTQTESLNVVKAENKLNGWQEKDGSWYFYKNDEKQAGWIQDKNSWYYLGPDGKMRTGWIKDNGKWYYLNTDGTMATNTTVDGCYINENGLIEETPLNTTKQNSVSKDTEDQNSLYKSDNPRIQKILGKWSTYFSGSMAFIRNYNCTYIDITTKTFQNHPYKVVEEHEGYIDIKMLDSNIGYRISFDSNTDLHVVLLNDCKYTEDEFINNTTASHIYDDNVCTFKRYQE